MATKLKNLEVTKIDFVDEGANPDAHIKLFKRKKEGAEAGAGAAEPRQNVWKKLFGAIMKAAGTADEDVDDVINAIEKSGAESFGSHLARRKSQKISDEIWDLCYALNSSLCSMLWDEELTGDDLEKAMQDSLEEFHEALKGAIPTWCAGNASGISKKAENTPEDAEILKRAKGRLDSAFDNSEAAERKETEPKGETKKMREINKTNMTPAERMVVEDIEKRYGYVENTEEPEPAPTVTKSAPAQQFDPADLVAKALKSLGIENKESVSEPEETIFKGLTPELRAEVESLMKFKRDAEEKELREVAKRYEIIGKKEDELYPVLKSLKEKDEAAYNEVIKVLDQSKEAVEKSGLFAEIGKVGHSTSAGSDNAWAVAEAKAVELMKSKTGITKAQALDEVLAADPELAKKCEEEE